MPLPSNWIWIFNPSKLPQFIYDLNNPWINKNKSWLEQRETPLQDLCDLDSPLRNEGIDGHVCPADLFKRLEVDNNRAGVDRPGWENALGRLRELKGCPAALNDVNHFHIDIFINEESFDPGDEIPQLFADVLAAMPNLKRLDWGLPVESTPFFETVFVQRNLSLPSVTHLVPGAFSHYLVPMCPNLEKLEAGSYNNHWSWNHYSLTVKEDPAQLLLAVTSLVPTISTLSYSKGRNGWDVHLAHKVLQAMPNLVSLTIVGDIKGGSDWDPYLDSNLDPDWWKKEDRGTELKALLNELKSFKKLEQLTLPHTSSLGLGFDGGAWCGNAYMGPSGRAYGRQVSKKSAEVTDIAGDITASILPHLKTFSISSYSPNIMRGDNGSVTLFWPWTGRMEEWLYEMWPEPEKGTPGYDN